MIDPHDNSFIAKNLRQEEWNEYKRSESVKGYADAIREAFSNGMVAKIDRTTLFNLGFDMACHAGTSAVLIQCSNHAHWCALSLCMLTHGKFEFFEEEKVYRFYKSSLEQEPMYHDNIEYIQEGGVSFLVPVRKKNEVKDIRTARLRENKSPYGVSGKGDRERDRSAQSSLFDIY